MKNRYNIISIVLVAFTIFGVASCDDYLEEVPQNQFFPTTYTDYRELLNFGYITDERIMPYIEALGDDIGFDEDDKMAGANTGTVLQDAGDAYIGAYMYYHSIEETLGEDIAFSRLYKSIYYANLVILNIDDASSDITGDDMLDDKANLKGEAYALRAFSYFYLVNLYGNDYDPNTASTDLGVPIIYDTDTEDKGYPRSSTEEVYDLIASDLELAVSLMTDNLIEKTSKVQFDAVSAAALQSRVALYMQDWDKTIEAANDVFTSESSIYNISNLAGTYNIANDGTYSTFQTGTDYLDIDNSNILFVNGANENIPILSIWPTATTFSVGQELTDSYEEGDIRRYYFIGTHTRAIGTLVSVKLNLIKNRENTPLATNAGYTSFQGYSRVIRTEEVLLNRAEAYAQNDELQLAIDDLNTLRVNKIDPSYYSDLEIGSFTKETLIEYIYAERRRELCFEGHRWFDLKRTTRPAMYRIGYDGEEAFIEQDDPRYVLQIPEVELQSNSSIDSAPR